MSTATRTAIERRMAELEITTNAELAERAGVDVNTTTTLAAETAQPRTRTRASLGSALGWPGRGNLALIGWSTGNGTDALYVEGADELQQS